MNHLYGGMRFSNASAELDHTAQTRIRALPADWANKFASAHGFRPPFAAGEMTEPWCETCCDFHAPADQHSITIGD